jgi:hypothetical protein
VSCLLIPGALDTVSGTISLESATSTVGTLKYTVNGQTYTGTWPISAGSYANGQSIFVQYSPSTPQTATSISVNSPWLTLGSMWLISVFCLIIGWGLFWLDTKSRTLSAMEGAGTLIDLVDRH